MTAQFVSAEPKSTPPEGTSWASHFFDLRNSPLAALVMPGLVEPCKADGTLNFELLNKKINRELQSLFGRETTITALRAERLNRELIKTPDVVVGIGEPVVKLKSPLLHAIVQNSIPIDGSTKSERGERYDGCTVSGLNLEISLGTEHLKMHLGDFDDTWWGRMEYTQLNRVFDGALSSRHPMSRFNHRYFADNPQEIAIFSALLTDLVADFHERKSGDTSQSRLFPRSSASFNADSVDSDVLRCLLIPSMDCGVAGSPNFREIVALLEPVVIGAEREGLAGSEKYRESLNHLQQQTVNLYTCINYNHHDYFTGVSPQFESLAVDIRHTLATLLTDLRTVAQSTESMLLFEQAHHAISAAVIACT